MAVLLYRVDERLIHGQVVLGWGTRLHPDRIVVVDDELADSQWEQELYTLGLPEEVRASFESVERARAELESWTGNGERILLLTRDLATMRRLAEGGRLSGREVNIGGIHHAAGRDKVLPYVFLGAAERDEIRALVREGAQVSARDLPAARQVDADALLGDG
jgi:PTS system mannose-specific IIB component/fructoselysine and glucoselysine-specific PTS system IIB component